MKAKTLTLTLALGLALTAAAQESDGPADETTNGTQPTEANNLAEPAFEAASVTPRVESQGEAQPGEPESLDARTAEAEAARSREIEAMVRSLVAEAMANASQQANGEGQGSSDQESVRPTRTRPAEPVAVPTEAAASVAKAVSAEQGTPGDQSSPAMTASGEEGLRLNFRNAPLDLVLNYLAEAAGFTIVLDTPVSGNLDVWNVEPLSKDEAVALLNNVLNKKGYAIERQGKLLTVYSARERPPVVPPVGGPEDISPTDEVVTQILQVKYVSASQLIRDLQPLVPSSSMTIANDGGNKIVIQDTRANIRRLYEIIDALDTPLATVSTIKVVPLRHADAQALATVINNLYQGQEQGNRAGSGNPFQQFFQNRGGGRGGGR